MTYVIEGMTDIDRPVTIGKGSNVILEKLLLGTVPESLSNIQSMIPGIRKQLGKLVNLFLSCHILVYYYVEFCTYKY